jgi:hypothetical protein
MKTRIQDIKSNLYTLETLVGSMVIPEGLPPSCLALGVDLQPSVTIHCEQAPNEHGRDLLLNLAAGLFGKEDWKRDLSWDNTKFHWRKTVNGVRLSIMDAELIPLPCDGTIVPATAFPILLHDSESVAA